MGRYDGVSQEAVNYAKKKFPNLFSGSIPVITSSGAESRHYPGGMKGQFIKEYEEAYWIPGRDQSEIMERYIRRLIAKRHTRREAEDKISSWLLEVNVE